MKKILSFSLLDLNLGPFLGSSGSIAQSVALPFVDLKSPVCVQGQRKFVFFSMFFKFYDFIAC